MKLFLRALVFLAATFVVVYIGMTNTGTIPFRFPLLFDHDIKQPAAIIYFGVFARDARPRPRPPRRRLAPDQETHADRRRPRHRLRRHDHA